jgi:heavy metal translocating P-type ATPase
VDLIALVAMAGALILGEHLAGAVIALMLAGGQALERAAGSRAQRELTALAQLAPRTVHRYEGTTLANREAAAVRPGDRLFVGPGEVVAVDGLVTGATAVLDESALTGEARPVRRSVGQAVQSGVMNAGEGFDLTATATADASTYAGILRLVREAQASKAPFLRMADRYALVFVPFTFATAGVAWIASGDAIRALAVLVVATPCPLILAAPIAMVSGISRAARRGIIMKGGSALESLAGAQHVLLDKTGTLTAGTPEVTAVETTGDPSELLRLAASLDQVSHHPYAAALVSVALDRGLVLSLPKNVKEEPGRGIEGIVGDIRVRLGAAGWVFPEGMPDALRSVRRRVALEGLAEVVVTAGDCSGVVVLEDPVRSDSAQSIRSLRHAGIREVIVVSGDRPDLAESIGEAVGADRILAQQSPEEKVEAVRRQARRGPTVMVGDGINDAAALAAADVGVALGARGAAAHSEAADIVIVVDRLERIVEALEIARRSRHIARQSVLAGMGLSALAMAAAAFGLLGPVAGAFLQEAIDVAAIANALRALSPGRRSTPPASAPLLAERLRVEHRSLQPGLEKLRTLADTLDALPPADALRRLRAIRCFLTDELAPHEEEDDRVLYPVVAALLGGEDPTGAMSRGHFEIRHLARTFCRLVDDLPEEGPGPEELRDLRRLLYELHAVLRLHFAQEEESYLSLRALEPTGGAVPAAPRGPAPGEP